MNIAQDTVVSLHYKLSDAQGNLIEESSAPMVYLHGGYGNTLPKIEAALHGQAVGFQTQLQVEPEDAFGEYDSELVKIEPRNLFPAELEVGMQFEGSPDDAPDADVRIFTVTDIADGKVVLDGNHPLAGMALRFALNVIEVRKASPEEVSHGHAHGPGGHHHHGHDDDEGRVVQPCVRLGLLIAADTGGRGLRLPDGQSGQPRRFTPPGPPSCF